jgi:abortive infection bacteriophage resistance protein
MMLYDKPALTSQQHVVQWQERGLHVPDINQACHYLDVISYYRLSAYSLPLQQGNTDHHFRPGTTFEQLLDHYIFDRELRLLLLDAIERIEVALRACMTNVLATNHGSHAYLDASIFDTRYRHDWLLQQVQKKCDDSHTESFIAHYRSKYSTPELPPVWMVMEILTFKEVSLLFSNLRLRSDKQAISRYWNIPDTLLRSWFRALSDLPNHCAHYSRVWNREFGSRPQRPRRPLPDWPSLTPVVVNSKYGEQQIDPSGRLYMMLVVIEYLLRRINPESDWHVRLYALLERHPGVSRGHMGIPEDWSSQSFWRLVG